MVLKEKLCLNKKYSFEGEDRFAFRDRRMIPLFIELP